MKKYALLILSGALCLSLVACGGDKDPKETSTPEPTQQVTMTDTPTAEPTKDPAGTDEPSDGSATYADNFAVDAEAATAFAKSVQEAVASKDIEKLADLMSFPNYVGFAEGGEMVETREDFIALGADAIFTDALLESIANAETEGLAASKAGFVLCGNEDGKPNIIFGVSAEGTLAINGINY